jgi:hypothetical protein
MDHHVGVPFQGSRVPDLPKQKARSGDKTIKQNASGYPKLSDAAPSNS